MAKKLYIGNLSYNTTEEQVRTLFAQAGDVASVQLITDRDTDRPKGFGFVEMANKDEAETAINALDGSELSGRDIRVNEARPRPERQQRY